MSFGWAPGAFVTTTGTSTTQQFDWTTEAFHSDASDSQSSDLENIADPEQGGAVILNIYGLQKVHFYR